MPQDITTSVIRNEDLGHGNYLLEFADAGMAQTMQPAQFLMIGVPGSETLLRRPYSVCGLPGTFEGRPSDSLQVLYKVYGKGTALLSSLAPGAQIRVLGPLGNGFTPPEGRPVFVAGGIGSAPFPALARHLEGSTEKPLMFYGARSAGDLPLLDWFQEHTELVACTDDGSLGKQGFVTGPLQELLSSNPAGGFHLYVCGPDPMLHAVRKIALAHDTVCDLALEAHMACGFGVCLGCVVPTRNETGDFAYERVCMEGPVMRATRVDW
jgi:dihydroorotate dehydrogenase electron transfer subunit